MEHRTEHKRTKWLKTPQNRHFCVEKYTEICVEMYTELSFFCIENNAYMRYNQRRISKEGRSYAQIH